MKIKNLRKYELIADFLIKLNLLVIPMYFVLYSGIGVYPWQAFLTDVVYVTVKAAGHPIERNGLTLTIFAPVTPGGRPQAESIFMGFDCAAWKTMYAFISLVIATPVPNDRKKLKFILAGCAVLFLINIVRLVSTVMMAYIVGLQYLEVMHTLLWREGLIIILLAIWAIWARKQKNNISRGQTILRRIYLILKKKGRRRRKR